MPGPAERWYMQQAEEQRRNQSQGTAPQAVSSVPQQSGMVSRLFQLGVDMALIVDHWAFELVDLPSATTCTREGEITRALSIVTSFAANCEVFSSSPWGNDGGVEEYSNAVNWFLEDTVDGRSWFELGKGGLYPRNSERIFRVVEPLGSQVRVRLEPCAVTSFFRPDGTFAGRNLVGNTKSAPRDLRVNMIIRSAKAFDTA